ncbi:MAG: hypothetical protein KatS3mg109_1833 [Pirellulaceae bacterium]|nr:MAG: hypothetical protein KatS3mg109_1833 [Pirellulaceae bacterium]GIW95990.1 MAG: hypothetical protein KatS3mg110_4031 [Pirellulaceae bacterium]
MEAKWTVRQLCEQHRLSVQELAEKSGVDEHRVMAIVLGRWTPSPEDRQKIAAVFGLSKESIVWGHTTPIQHIYGHGPT